jgi:2-polyprenyl-3-methyl-5-hydroxy-6-metoxy-1,4-benzoquinol methylase
MTTRNVSLSAEDADRLRAFERQRHDKLAPTYQDFFSPVTALAISPLLNAAQVRPGATLLDVATGPGSLALEATKLGMICTGVDLSPGMIQLAEKSNPAVAFRVIKRPSLQVQDVGMDGGYLYRGDPHSGQKYLVKGLPLSPSLVNPLGLPAMIWKLRAST